jgi:hypothetical protein
MSNTTLCGVIASLASEARETKSLEKCEFYNNKC